jgi:hypothetical protein
MLAAVMGEQSISEDKVRQIIFECYCAAFSRGYDSCMKQNKVTYSEDMGR